MKAENWNPKELVALYKKAGSQYFMALANHQDNFDLYNSGYQSWNSTKRESKEDIVGGWAKAAKQHGVLFGVSIHATHTWSWLETAQRSDKNGPFPGIPYNGGIVIKANGTGKWPNS